MRLLLIHAAADFSTADVANGIRDGLLAEGVEVHDYRLNRRLQRCEQALMAMAGPGQGNRVDDVELALWAAEGIPFQAIAHRCDWALFVNGMGLHPGALVTLRRIGVRIAGWYTEGPYESNEDRELHLASFCDVCFVNERTSVRLFQEMLDRVGRGGKAVYLPHAFRPDLHKPSAEPGAVATADRCDVLFIGTGFPQRQWLIEAIDWTGIDLRLGGMWPGIDRSNHLAQYYVYPCLPNQETVRLYGGAKIVLNPHRWHPTAESANPRLYEVAACGVFQLADRRAEIAELFGEAVPVYEPGVPWQLAALIRRYLADEAERRRLAALALARVQGQTFQARARTIVETLAAPQMAAGRVPVLAIAGGG